MFSSIDLQSRTQNKPLRWENVSESGQSANSHHSACENCRSKKLKCSGQRPSCTRCSDHDMECKYPPPGRRHHKKAALNNTSNSRAGSVASEHRSNSWLPQKQPFDQIKSGSTKAPSTSGPDPKSVQNTDDSSPQPSKPADETFSSEHGMKIRDQEVIEMEATLDDFLQQGHPWTMPGSSEADCDSAFQDFALSDLSGNPDPRVLPGAGSGVSPWDMDIDPTNGQTYSLSNLDKSLPQSQEIQEETASRGSSIPTKGSQSPEKRRRVSCPCREKISIITEEWEIQNEGQERAIVDEGLAWQRRALEACGEASECDRCSLNQSAMTLQLVLCEHLLQSFQNLSEGEVEVQSRFNQLHLEKKRSSSVESTSSREQILSSTSLGQFELKSPEEWQCCVGILALYQIADLVALIQRLRERSDSKSWAMQSQYASSLESRTKLIKTQGRKTVPV